MPRQRNSEAQTHSIGRIAVSARLRARWDAFLNHLRQSKPSTPEWQALETLLDVYERTEGKFSENFRDSS